MTKIKYISALAVAFLGILSLGIRADAESFNRNCGRFVYNKNVKNITGYVLSSNPEKVTLSVSYESAGSDNYSEASDVLYIGNKDGEKIYRVGFSLNLLNAPVSISLSDDGTPD